MKRIIIMLVVFASIANTVIAAGDDRVTAVAKKSFEKEFPGAQFPKWQKLDHTDTYIVRFVYNEQALLSYINEEGVVLATVRNLDKERLPFMVNETIAKKFGQYRIDRIEELTTASDVSYLFSLENVKSKIYLRVYNNGSFYELKKEKKKNTAALIQQ